MDRLLLINITQSFIDINKSVKERFCGPTYFEQTNSVKYFCENAPQYHIACAGSLLGIALAKPSSFPVGNVSFMADQADRLICLALEQN